MPILITLSNWLHALATMVFVGYFVLLALNYLPALSKDGDSSTLSEISKRSHWWLYTSLLIFIVTGTYLKPQPMKGRRRVDLNNET